MNKGFVNSAFSFSVVRILNSINFGLLKCCHHFFNILPITFRILHPVYTHHYKSVALHLMVSVAIVLF